ncbi:hypothetical protein JXB02_06245 [Candidatus Woesearchaeota archaeon]|nr:hypothetical protein [Candidatus Woesearchaeota archaeon]
MGAYTKRQWTEELKFSFIKTFNPIWFATVLGFGGIALASELVRTLFNIQWLNFISFFLVYSNLILFIFLFLVWTLKVVFHLNSFIAELKHPVIAGFHSLMPAAIIMVSINFSKLGPILSLWNYQGTSILLWMLGAVIEFMLLTLTIYYLIVNEEMHINFVNGGWLVPPVAALLTTIAGLNLVKYFSTNLLGECILWINSFFFGVGFFIFVIMATALFDKIFFLEKLDPKVFPSLWIILVPFSLTALSLSLFADQISAYLPNLKNALMGIASLINPMLIGVSIWLLITLIVLTYHYLRNIKLPYGVGWWAFIFPTASVAIASLNQAVLFEQRFFAYCGIVIYIFLITIFIIVLLRTIRHFLPFKQTKKINDENG